MTQSPDVTSSTGISITAYTLIDAWAIVELRADPLAYYFTSQVFRAILFAPAALAAFDSFREALRDSKREAGIIGVLSPTAFLLVLFALQLAPVSQVAPLREISMLFGALRAACTSVSASARRGWPASWRSPRAQCW